MRSFKLQFRELRHDTYFCATDGRPVAVADYCFYPLSINCLVHSQKLSVSAMMRLSQTSGSAVNSFSLLLGIPKCSTVSRLGRIKKSECISGRSYLCRRPSHAHSSTDFTSPPSLTRFGKRSSGVRAVRSPDMNLRLVTLERFLVAPRETSPGVADAPPYLDECTGIVVSSSTELHKN